MYNKILKESDDAYSKILESTEMLYNMVVSEDKQAKKKKLI